MIVFNAFVAFISLAIDKRDVGLAEYQAIARFSPGIDEHNFLAERSRTARKI